MHDILIKALRYNLDSQKLDTFVEFIKPRTKHDAHVDSVGFVRRNWLNRVVQKSRESNETIRSTALFVSI